MSKLPFDLTNSSFVKAAELAHLAERPLPTAPDGAYDYQALAPTEHAPSGPTPVRAHSSLYSAASALQGALARGPPLPPDPRAADAVLQAITSPTAIDDRRGLFTTALSALTRLPAGALQDSLNDQVMATLYETLPHPPATLMDEGHRYRSADGGGNNVVCPEMGRAGMPYARSVQRKHPLPAHMLPDPGLVFDTLLKARDFKPHPGRNSALTFAFASLVTHSLFKTDPSDWSRNNTSSYLDLSPLYGTNQLEQDLVRDKEGGRGRLWRDTFAEDRLRFLPPAASALLVLFSRNHNYIADMLLSINEKRLYADPDTLDARARAAQDESLFQTARLVNCGHFMALIFGDYVAGFLGLGRDGCTWSMNPFDPIRKPAFPGDRAQGGERVPRGTGNHVSVEFNVLYRWHATTAQEDVRWTEGLLEGVFKGRKLEEVGMEEFREAAREVFRLSEPDPRKRTFPRQMPDGSFKDLERQPDGSFADADLAAILHSATEKVAGAYRARGTPACLRIVEILGLTQSRQWGVCTLNEFRSFLGLRRFSSFSEWSSDPSVASAAERLYGHIDNLELYPGLQAEDCMPLGPGSGICCGYTMTRAILADAIALVRGDRFYTTDYGPEALTAWGFQDCARDPANGAFGAALPKLLMRHLPRHYPADSVYALFPFFTPEATRENLGRLGLEGRYSFGRPRETPVPRVLGTLEGIRGVFGDARRFRQIYTRDMRALTRGYGFMLVFDDDGKGGRERHERDRRMCWHALCPDGEALEGYARWYRETTVRLVEEGKWAYEGVKGTYVDVVRDVINLVSAHWAADMLCGIPMKTRATPHGLLTPQEVYGLFAVLFTCVFENVAPEHGWTLREAAATAGALVNALIQESIEEVAPRAGNNPLKTLLASLKGFVTQSLLPTALAGSYSKKECAPFLTRLVAAAGEGRPIDELVACVIGLAVGSSVNFAQACAQVVDFYLSEGREKEREALVEACVAAEAAKAASASSSSPSGKKSKEEEKAMERVRGFVREGMRLNPQFGGLFRVCEEDAVVGQGEGFVDVHFKKGDWVFASFKNAFLNPADFPNPTAVDPTRPASAYANLQGAGFHGCPGLDFVSHTLPEVVVALFGRLQNLRRAPGRQGASMSEGFVLEQFGTRNDVYVDARGMVTPWPGSLQLVFDE